MTTTTWRLARAAIICATAWLAVTTMAHEGLPASPVAVPYPRCETVSHASAVLRRPKRFSAVLPEGHDASRGGWPLLVLLHGRGRTDRSLLDDPEARGLLLGSRAVVLLPHGDDGWYINSPVRPDDRYGDWLDEVVALAEARYGISPDPARRGIAGWSMGGYGAILYAAARPGRFGAAGSIIGLLDFPRDGLPDRFSYRVPAERFGNEPSDWEALNPLNHAAALEGVRLFILTADTAFDRVMNENFHRRLEALHIDHAYTMLSGGHTFAVVKAALVHLVPFMNTALAPERLPAPEGQAAPDPPPGGKQNAASE